MLSNFKKMTLGFGAVICLLITMSGLALYELNHMAQIVDDIFRHPFTVSNAAKQIDFHFVSMHRHMKDVVLAQNEQQLDEAIHEVTVHELKALQEFKLINERFLGEKTQIERTYKLFIAWKPIRDDVIRMSQKGEKTAAGEITKTRGAEHVAKLNSEVDALVTFAFLKAQEFQKRASDTKKEALIIIFTLGFLAVMAALFIALSVIKSTISTTKILERRAHLIDQNIMIATLDLDGTILDVSNSLCRFLGSLKSDLIGKSSHFFDNSEESSATTASIFKMVKTGKAWKGEIKRLSDDGDIQWASSSVLPNYNNRYELMGYTNILVDSTNKRMSVTDKLTTLYNRRRYEEVIQRELRLAKRNQKQITLAMIDIDFFKNYNDHYGHPKGDVVLTQVAQQLLKHMKRPDDYAFRMGGEEFALIFSSLSKEESKRFLNKIRASIEILAIEHAKSSVSEVLTISIGAYVIDTNIDAGIDEAHLYILADKALYMAKNERNKVCVAAS